MSRIAGTVQLVEAIGTELGVSGWHEITQDMVDRFADLTGDHQWVHTDPVRAAAGPFGAPIAHGFLILALTTAMLFEVVRLEDVALVLNKGLNRTRITAPVRVGDRVRGRMSVASARARPHGYWEIVFGIAVEAAGATDPVLTTDLLFLLANSKNSPATDGINAGIRHDDASRNRSTHAR